MSKSYLDVTHQPLACWGFFWSLWRPGPIGTWWNRLGERGPWATCSWGSVLVPLGPVSFIYISFLLYPNPPLSALKTPWINCQIRACWIVSDCLLSWVGRKDRLLRTYSLSSWVHPRLERKEKVRNELHNYFQQAPCFRSLGVVAELDIVHSVCWPSEGCQVHLGSYSHCQRVRSSLSCQIKDGTSRVIHAED